VCARRRFRAYHDANPKKVMLFHAKSRARRAGLPFNLTEDDIDIPTHCPVLGIPLARHLGGTASDASPSLDRIRPELGYTRGNVVVMSNRANTIKSHATSHELITVGQWLATMGA
jgi:hypothetical protein